MPPGKLGTFITFAFAPPWPGPTGAVWRWNLTNVQRHLRWMHLAQGLAPSQGREDWTHWSQACLEVVARLAAPEPLRRELPAAVDSPLPGAPPTDEEELEERVCLRSGWHLLMCRERRSLLAN